MISSEELVGYTSTINVKKGNGRVKLANLQLRRMVRKPEASMAAFKKNFTSKTAQNQFGQKIKPKT